jgi:hypothetical protein
MCIDGGGGGGGGVEAILRLELRWREIRVQWVVRVPPTLLTLEILPTPMASAPTPVRSPSHAILQDRNEGIMLTFTPDLIGEGAGLRFLIEEIFRLN